jgi:hypothetical protein
MRKKLLLTAAALLTLSSVLAGAGGAASRQEKADSAAKITIHDHAVADGSASSGKLRSLARKLARARLATAKYALDLEAAKADGYFIITRMIPDMGYHYLNPNISEFDVTKPPILVYAHRGDSWQLVAFEWVFTEKPEEDPLPGARYGSFGAACHYEDGTFVFKRLERNCPETSPETGTEFVFWHPKLVTLHLWSWYHNPDGIYNGTNPLMRPFNEG